MSSEAETVEAEPTQSIEDFIQAENRAERSARAGTPVESPSAAAAPLGTESPVSDVEVAAVAGEPTVQRDPQTGQFAAKPGKPRDDPRARMLDATAKEATAKRERDEARAENTRLKAELEASRRPAQSEVRSPKPEAAKPAADDDPEPQEGQYEDYRQFVKAQARWEARQEFKEQETKRTEREQRSQAEREHHTRETAWQGRLTDARAKPDYEARLAAVTPTMDQVQISAPMRHIITESEVGPELFLYLCEHPDDAQRLSTLHPAQVLREMGKLEARLEAATPVRGPALVVPHVSQAKPPIKPLGTSPQVADPYETSEATETDEWIRRENAKERRERAGR